MRRNEPNGEVFNVNSGLEVPPEIVRAELDRVLASDAFSRAERPGRFLQFLVESVLTGHADKINEYTLAGEIFNRPPTFDPGADPIVRVEAGRLRRRLQEYYNSEGREHPVVIALPQRTYIPVFHILAPAPVARPGADSGVPAPKRWKAAAVLVACLVIAGLAAVWALLRKPVQPKPVTETLSTRRSVVVLPFTDLTPSRDQGTFADGLTDELTEALTKVEGLRVVARSSALQFRNKPQDARVVGRKLNVGLVLEGSVRTSGSGARVMVELIDADTGFYFWSRTYDRDPKDLIDVQEEIAHNVAGTLRREIIGHRVALSTTSIEAYDLYLKGLTAVHDWSADALAQGVAALQRAIAKDPDFAPAHAALAECYALQGVFAGLPPREVMPKAKQSAQRALSLDHSLARAHASRALVAGVYEWDWNTAEENFRDAFQSADAGAEERQMYVLGYLAPKGRLDEALRQLREARSEDPLSPHLQWLFGMVYYFRREYAPAVEYFRKPLQLDPRFDDARVMQAAGKAPAARAAEAFAAMHEGAAVWRSGRGMSPVDHAEALLGERVRADGLIRELLAFASSNYVSPGYVAAIYAGLGDKDRTLEWLEKAYQSRAASLVFLNLNPRFDGVRSDPRFQSLLTRLRLR